MAKEGPHSPVPAPAANHGDDTPESRLSWREVVRRWLRTLFIVRRDASIKEALEEAIEEVLEEREDQAGQLAPEETTILRNALTFGDITVHDIMTPRPDIVGISQDISLEALNRHIIEQRHTRIPVFAGSMDHVEGFLHIKDLFAVLAGDQPYDLKRLLRPMLFVPPSMKVLDLLVSMRRQSIHMAIVVDEYGGTDGLITLEDVFEEIIGDIQDEHDEDDGPQELIRVGPNAYEADARLRISRLESVLGLNLLNEHEEEEFDTLGGLIFFELGRVPSRGERIGHSSGVQFEILEADPRRIRRVRIQAAPEALDRAR